MSCNLNGTLQERTVIYRYLPGWCTLIRRKEGLRVIGTMQGVDMLWVVIQLQIGVTASFSFCLFSFQLRSDPVISE